jgi:hypothetical protein
VWRAPDVELTGLSDQPSRISVEKMKEYDDLSPEWQQLMRHYGFSNVGAIVRSGATPQQIEQLCKAKLKEPV